MNNKELFENVRSLNLPIGEYAIFGSGPMGIRGMRELHDIDLIVSEKIYVEYKKKEGWQAKEVKENNDCFKGLVNHNLNIEMWKDWYTNWYVKELIDEAEIIDGLPFVKLDVLVKWKGFYGREKDLKDVEIIDKYCNSKNSAE